MAMAMVVGQAPQHHAERDGYVPLTLSVSFGQVRQVG